MDRIIITTEETTLRRIIREEMHALLLSLQPPSKESEFSERLTRKQAARFLGLQYNTMYHWIKRGLIKEHGQGRKRYFLKSELIKAMEND